MKKLRTSATGSLTRRTARRLLAVTALVAGIGVAAPVGPALALDRVPCDREDYLKVAAYKDYPIGGRVRWDSCAANGGILRVDAHVTQISTGNNDILYVHDGMAYRLGRWTVLILADQPYVESVQIL